MIFLPRTEQHVLLHCSRWNTEEPNVSRFFCCFFFCINDSKMSLFKSKLCSLSAVMFRLMWQSDECGLNQQFNSTCLSFIKPGETFTFKLCDPSVQSNFYVFKTQLNKTMRVHLACAVTGAEMLNETNIKTKNSTKQTRLLWEEQKQLNESEKPAEHLKHSWVLVLHCCLLFYR